MLRKIKSLILFMLLGAPLFGNNLNLGNTVRTSGLTTNEVTLSVSVSWENSWRDSYNNDAAWIFLKYRTTSDPIWKQVVLQGDATVGGGYVTLPGRSAGGVVGMFIYRDSPGYGAVSTDFKIKWNYAAVGLTRQMFDEQKVFVMAQGVEMVYIPYGPYRIGDGASQKTLGDRDGRMLEVTASGEMVNLYADGTQYALRENYPNAFDGYYLMKYEVSQEQYVAFLNALTLTEQKMLLGDRITSLKRGQYIFGSPSEPSKRNGIVVSQPASGEDAIIFDNNFTNNDVFGAPDDGQTLACNYLNVNDMVAYSSWTGLRPMSEMEYEKACRRLSPMGVVPEEYAWGTISLTKMTGIDAEGKPGERPRGGNVNAENSAGPVRCGSFALSGTSRETSGAGFSGVMEMSGNVKELCVNVYNLVFQGEKHGNGIVDMDLWGEGTVPSYYGVRGGGFSSEKSLLRVSDRSEMDGYLSSVTSRDSTIGFRSVRMLDHSDLKIDPGTIRVAGNASATPVVCSGDPFYISSGTPASVKQLSGITFRYEWYLNDVLLPDATGESLSYPTGIYNVENSDEIFRFKRKAICYAFPEGAMTDEIRISVPGRLQILAGGDAPSLECGVGTTLTATLRSPGKFCWKNGTDNRMVQDWCSTEDVANDYTASHAGFGYAPADKILRCVSNSGGCLDSTEVLLHIGNSCVATLTKTTLTLNSSTDVETTKATLCGAGKIQWIYKASGVEKILKDESSVKESSYTPSYADFGAKIGQMEVICRTVTGSGSGSCAGSDIVIPVTVNATLDPGSLKEHIAACPGEMITIESTKPASVTGMELTDITYVWYHNETQEITGQTGEKLINYKIPANTDHQEATHTFHRLAKSVAIGKTSAKSNVVSIPVPGIPSVTIEVPAAVCAGANLAMAVPEILWAGPQGAGVWKLKDVVLPAPYTVQFASNGHALTYVATNACVSAVSNSVNIVVNAKPTVAKPAVPAALCEGINLTLPIVPAITWNGIEGTGTWKLNGGAIPQPLTVANNGQLLTYVAKNTCGETASEGVAVTVYSRPSATSITSANNPVCTGTSTTLTVSITGGTKPYTYALSGISSASGQPEPTATYSTGNLTTTTGYTLSNVKDKNNCVFSGANASTTVTVLVKELANVGKVASDKAVSILHGDRFTLSVSGGSIIDCVFSGTLNLPGTVTRNPASVEWGDDFTFTTTKATAK